MNAARQFSGDRSGAAAIVYGLTVIPFALMAGAAIDYSRASAAKSALQQATDAVALSVAVNLSPSSDLAAAQNTADKLLKARSKLPGLKILAATLSADKKKFCVTTEAGIPTAMMQLAKVEVMKASSHACAELGASGQTYEIALALDTSGSMNQSAGGMSKLQALKTAATHFINTMHAHAPGKVKMSITPFAGMVIPVDPSVTGNRALPWICLLYTS
ncbi:MAG: pilus assembly protein, partial [Methylocystis sp.]|nr:pilus assembly protein [Methylocystis sp.]